MATAVPEVEDKDILNPQDLEELYTWIDAAPLSRPKKHIARDFSDGVSVAEIVHYYMPRSVELHNYVNANSTSQKRINWNMLNRKVFVKLNMKLSEKIIENVIDAKSGAIEQVLWDLRKKIVEVNPKSLSRVNTSSQLKGKGSSTTYSEPNSKQGKRVPSTAQAGGPGHTSRIPTKSSLIDGHHQGRSRERSRSSDGISYSAGLKDELSQFGQNLNSDIAKAEIKAVSGNSGQPQDLNANSDGVSLPPAHLIYKGHKMVPSMLLDIKNRQIRDLEVVVNGLQKKVTFLDNLIQLKDSRIEDLTRQVHTLRSRFQELTQSKLPEL